MKTFILAAALALVGAGQANAATVTTVTPGPMAMPTFAVSAFYDFESGLPSNFSGGTVVSGNVQNVYDAPFGDSTRYLAVGPVTGNPSTVDLAGLGPISMMSLYWGSPDSSNAPFSQSISLLNAAGDVISQIDADNVGGVRNFVGNDSVNVTIALTAAETAALAAVRFSSGSQAFELDNLAFGNAVPEPATWAMMISGFAMAAGALRSRRRRSGTLAAA